MAVKLLSNINVDGKNYHVSDSVMQSVSSEINDIPFVGQDASSEEMVVTINSFLSKFRNLFGVRNSKYSVLEAEIPSTRTKDENVNPLKSSKKSVKKSSGKIMRSATARARKSVKKTVKKTEKSHKKEKAK